MRRWRTENGEQVKRPHTLQTWLSFVTSKTLSTLESIRAITNSFFFIHSCPSGDNEVLFLYNEKPLVIPGCESNGLCKVSFILEKYSRFLTADCPNTFCKA